MSTLNLQVAASNRDGHQLSAGTFGDITASSLPVGSFGGNSVVAAVAFLVAISQGETINQAILTITWSDTYNAGGATIQATIYGEAADNAAVFAATNGNISGRSNTTANVGTGSLANVVTDQERQFDVTAIVQEIVNRSGWSSGNAMAFLLRDNGSDNQEWQEFYAHDGSTTKAAKLDIDFGSSGHDDLLAAVGIFTLAGQAAALLRAVLLTANQASFTLSGQAAALRIDRLALATQASFVLSGQAANLRAGYRLAANQASFTLSGQAAALRVDRLTVVTQASFVLSGQAAALLSDRLLTANQQSYTLSGQDANLDYSGAGGYTISAGQANFTLDGQAAILQAQRTISSAQASFALAGQDVNLLADRLLTISQATYTMSGEDAFVLAGRMISAGQANYVLAGQDVAYVVDYVVVATYAAFTLAGHDILFDYSGIETPVERVYSIDAESRLYLIGAENRVLPVGAEARVYAIT
ncbi:MAG: hypothetical protein KJ063_02455 [Anaerolineae bacterium]|nr:hypothetical protein [Anaerolineae bacterium]